MSRRITNFAKMSAVVIGAVLAIILTGSISVKAEPTEFVRVSTQKELEAAMNDPDVLHIIFKTDAYINVTINPVEAAKEKSLEIRAENVNFTNKAVFEYIRIYYVNSFTEKVSGNRFYLEELTYNSGIVVAKNQQVDYIRIAGTDFKEPLYTLRKGAKVKEVELEYDYPDFSESEYNKSKRQLTLDVENRWGFKQVFNITLDKNGRMTRMFSESDNAEYAFEYNFTYDKNGNIFKKAGCDYENGEFTTEYTYNGNLLEKKVTEGTNSEVTVYEYDEKGRLIRLDSQCETFRDGKMIDESYIDEYKYDKKGRVVYEKTTYPYSTDVHEITYTFNSKGFHTKIVTDDYNGLYINILKFKYNKAGDLIKETDYNADGTVRRVLKIKWNELGESIDSSEKFY